MMTFLTPVTNLSINLVFSIVGNLIALTHQQQVSSPAACWGFGSG